MKVYKENEGYFIERGFFAPIAEKVLRIANLTVWDAYWIFDEAKRIPNAGIYLEIGSHLGGSLLSAYFGTKFVKRSVNFIAIEKAVTIELQANTRQIPHLEIISLSSELAKNQIQDNSVDMLFIDADHRYQFVKMDIENYWPKVRKGGILLGHDYNNTDFPGVTQAADEVFGKDKLTSLKSSFLFEVKK